MQSFLKKLGLFLAVGFSGYAILFAAVLVLNVRAADSCHLESDVDSIIIGDSHTMWSIDDADIEGLRNVSLNAEGYKYTFHKLERILQQNPKIERVYLGADVHNFSSYYDEYIWGGSFKFFAHRYLSLLGPSDYLQIAARSPGEIPALLKMLVTEGLRPGLKKSCQLYGTFPDEKMEQVYDPESMRERIAAQYFDEGHLRGISRSNLEYFNEIVELCREHEVKLIVLSTPVHPDYRARVPGRFTEKFEELIQSEGLSHYDFRDLALSDAAFLPDGDHLNFAGAQLTTEKFRDYHADQ